MLVKKLQAKHIPDSTILSLMFMRETVGHPFILLRDFETLMPTLPLKVVMARMGQLIKSGLVDGCACGCSGVFALTPKGKVYLSLILNNVKENN